MGLDLAWAVDRLSDRLHLLVRDNGNSLAVVENRMNTWSRQNMEPAAYPPAQEDVAREEGQRQQLATVLPTPHGVVKGQENLEPLRLENLRHGLLMLVARIDRPPRGRILQISVHLLYLIHIQRIMRS